MKNNCTIFSRYFAILIQLETNPIIIYTCILNII